MVYNECKNYHVARKLVFKEALNVLNVLGFKVENCDEISGVIEAKKGASFRSWGEHIKISITLSDGGSKVHVESHEKYQVVDYGKNKENVQRILTELDNRLLSSAGVPPPPPPTPTLSRACPTCGQALIFVQQYGRWYCPNCKKYP
jgi:hypothetical protein